MHQKIKTFRPLHKDEKPHTTDSYSQLLGDVVIARWYFLDSRLTAGYNIGLTHGDHHANIDARPSAAAA